MNNFKNIHTRNVGPDFCGGRWKFASEQELRQVNPRLEENGGWFRPDHCAKCAHWHVVPTQKFLNSPPRPWSA